MLTDIVTGLRGFRKRPGVYWSCVFALAIGISVAGVSHALLWSLLSPNVPHTDEVATIGVASPAGGIAPLPGVLFEALSEQSTTYSAIAGFKGVPVTVSWDSAPRRRVRVAGVTHGLFRLLQARPQLGRGFVEDDYAAGATPVAMLSYGYWRRVSGGDPAIVQRSLRIGGATARVVGVLPRDFNLDLSEVFVPAARVGPSESVSTWVRRQPGISWATARAELAMVVARMGTSSSRRESSSNPPVRLATIPDQMRLRKANLILVLPLLVVLIACLNAGNLLLTHAMDREQEVAVRLALGATRARLTAQFLAEGLLIAAPAGFVAAGLVPLEVLAVRVAGGGQFAWLLDVFAVHAKTWLFVAGVSILTPLVFGFAPLLYSVRLNISAALHRGGRNTQAGLAPIALRNLLSARFRLCDLLLVLEVAGTFGLVATFAVMHGLSAPLTLPSYGFDTETLLVLSPTGDAGSAELEGALARIDAVSGVSGTAVADVPPLSGFGSALVSPAGLESEPRTTRIVGVDSQYFACLGVHVKGRGIGRDAVLERQDVAVIGDSLARQLWPGAEAIGRTITVRSRGGERDVTLQVTGTVPDLAFFPSFPPSRNSLYVPLGHPLRAAGGRYGLVRTLSVTRPGLAALNAAVEERSIEPGVEVLRLLWHGELAEEKDRFSGAVVLTRLVGVIGVAALLLALAGLIAVVRQAVRLNARDLGIRAALGAAPSRLVRLVLRHTLARTAVGLTVGLVIPFVYWSRQSLSEIGSSPLRLLLDPQTGSFLLAAIVAVVAGSYWPARAAGRQDPAAVMRDE